MPNPLDMSFSMADPGNDNQEAEDYEDGLGHTNNGLTHLDSPLVQQTDAVAEWAQKNGYRLNNQTIDYLYNQFFNEKNTASAWERTMTADNTKYQRAVRDMQAAGLNPFLLMSNGASNAGSASSGSIGSGSIASRLNQNKQSNTQIASAIMGAIGTMIGAAIIALL